MQSTQEIVRGFILSEFLEGEDPSELDDSTPLVSTGVIDSVATLRLITFLEEKFGIRVDPDEAVEENLETIGTIVGLVQSKLGGH